MAGCLQVMSGAVEVKGARSPHKRGRGEGWGGTGRRWVSGEEFDWLGRWRMGRREWREVAVTSYQHCHQCSLKSCSS